VFAAGEPTELCHTPCALQIERTDGDAGDRRAFVVRRTGYRDAAIAVDLTAAQRDFRVDLQPIAAATRPAAEPKPERRPPRRSDRPPASAAPRPAARDPHERPPDSPPAEPPAEPAAARPSPSTIDPADTLDPFRKK
jgi:hypothetical protein